MTKNQTTIPTLNPVFASRRAYRLASPHQEVWDLLDKVDDPEIPGMSIWDLGVLQDVEQIENSWQVKITPTYSGCPAVEAIRDDIVKAMSNADYLPVKVKTVLAPAWTTEMVSPKGKAHLKSIHIAPPESKDKISCPLCDSENTQLVSQFGSTACKALYQCQNCLEHFDYFKHF